MKISIITVCYNSAKTIERTIKSVLMQKKVDLEYIIKDGDSTDDTVEIIKSYAKRNPCIKYICAPDKGIYDAMNQGIEMAQGDIVGILNSDDYYAAPYVLFCIVNAFEEHTKADLVYGNILYVKENKPYRAWKGGESKSFVIGWMPPHPALFVKKAVYDTYGVFRLDCGINADYEIMLRFFEKEHLKSCWLDKTVTYMEAGGRSNNGIASRITGIRNDRLAWKKNGLEPRFYTLAMKKLRKLPQFITAKIGRQES